MTVRRFTPKPKQVDSDQFAARFTPGEAMTDLLEVARMADPDAQIAEVEFPFASTVLVVRYRTYRDAGPPSEVAYETVEAGDWLAYSTSYDSLYDASDGDWRQWYQETPLGDRR